MTNDPTNFFCGSSGTDFLTHTGSIQINSNQSTAFKFSLSVLDLSVAAIFVSVDGSFKYFLPTAFFLAANSPK